MKKLTDYKEEIHKCSKCGLCQSVCPVYEQTGNDCSVSRGKFIMLNGIIKGDLKLNKNINKYLDMCLKCNACKNFCPSGIDAREIFITAKSEYFKICPERKFISLFQSKFVFNLVLNLVKIATTTYRFLNLDKIVTEFYPMFLKMGWFGKKVILANEFVSTKQSEKCKMQKAKPLSLQTSKPLNAVYFKGCVNEYINPRAKIATENVLNKLGVEVLETQFKCCGVPFLSCGNTEQFKKQAEFNLAQIPDEFDYFLTDCASCQNAFEEYKNYIEDENLLKKLDKILEKSLNINEFIIKNVESIEFEEITSFTFHKPCHLENTDFIREILVKSKNVEYIEMKDFDKCCGFSGEFAIKNPELSKQISLKKAQNATDTNADFVLTTCPACILGLTQGTIETGQKFTPTSLVEFIALAKISISMNSNKSKNKEGLEENIETILVMD